MDQLPKIVQERLRAAVQPEVHPDPDLLTAFTEQSLSSSERGIVLEHLAQCADCREVLSLAGMAMPEVAEQEAVAATAAWRSSGSRWFRPSMLRWAGVAASVVVVSAVALLLREQKSSPNRA